jgi:hypothetical protein
VRLLFSFCDFGMFLRPFAERKSKKKGGSASAVKGDKDEESLAIGTATPGGGTAPIRGGEACTSTTTAQFAPFTP